MSIRRAEKCCQQKQCLILQPADAISDPDGTTASQLLKPAPVGCNKLIAILIRPGIELKPKQQGHGLREAWT